MKIHPIPPGLYCVPSTLCALTGADPESVIIPAINRHSPYHPHRGLFDTPVAVSMTAADVLKELGYRVRPYKDGAAAGPMRAHIATWATRSRERWPGKAVLIATQDHCLVVKDGIVYDNHNPIGEPGSTHPFGKTTVVRAYLVEEA